MAEASLPRRVPRPRWLGFGRNGVRLSTSIAMAASGLAATMILIIGAVSYFVIRAQVTEAIKSDLQSEAALFAQHVSDGLGVLL